MSNPKIPPDATLYMATGCAHCPAVLQGLGELLKQGTIGRLEVINIAAHPQIAREQGIRSVPWIRIGPFDLQGSYSTTQLREWVERVGSDQGLRDYLAELIESQRLDEALQQARSDPHWLELAVDMIADLETPMGVRIGIGAMFEDLADTHQLNPALPGLKALLNAPESQVRADAAYYLGLTHDPEVLEWIKPLLEDVNAEVREIAGEALA